MVSKLMMFVSSTGTGPLSLFDDRFLPMITKEKKNSELA